jgi:hypothetical protein
MMMHEDAIASMKIAHCVSHFGDNADRLMT